MRLIFYPDTWDDYLERQTNDRKGLQRLKPEPAVRVEEELHFANADLSHDKATVDQGVD